MVFERLPILEQKLGHVFADKYLLRAALTHASVLDSEEDYERLEFLGDRVLGLAVAELLYKTFPDDAEGDLAKRHTGLVQQTALLRVAEKIDLASFLNLSQGELKTGGLQKETILADAQEAVIAAVHLDGGYATGAALVARLWSDMLHAQMEPPQDAKTQLQEWAQGQGLPLPEYVLLAKAGADHAPVFDIEVRVENYGGATARAASKRLAEKEAARMMLEKVKGSL
jgi:ribonuclease-3